VTEKQIGKQTQTVRETYRDRRDTSILYHW